MLFLYKHLFCSRSHRGLCEYDFANLPYKFRNSKIPAVYISYVSFGQIALIISFLLPLSLPCHCFFLLPEIFIFFPPRGCFWAKLLPSVRNQCSGFSQIEGCLYLNMGFRAFNFIRNWIARSSLFIFHGVRYFDRTPSIIFKTWIFTLELNQY